MTRVSNASLTLSVPRIRFKVYNGCQSHFIINKATFINKVDYEPRDKQNVPSSSFSLKKVGSGAESPARSCLAMMRNQVKTSIN